MERSEMTPIDDIIMGKLTKEGRWQIATEEFKIQQIREEWEWLIEMTVAKWDDKKEIFEIGCYDGGSTYYLSTFANEMITIDNNFPCRFNVHDIPCGYVYIGGDSHDPDNISAVFDEHKLNPDFCFIDGDHSFEGVKADFYNVLPYLKKGTPVAFHDIVISDFHHEHGCYVGEFWQELKEKFDGQTEEFVTNETWGGIGIVWV